jgi:hypothetical protein
MKQRPQNTAAAVSSPAKPAVSAPAPTHEEIAAVARSIWESRGSPQNQDEEIWYEAERKLKAGSVQKTVEKKAFADPKRLLDKDGNPADRVDRSLQNAAAPTERRSATSLV